MQDEAHAKHLAIPAEYDAVLRAVNTDDRAGASNAFYRVWNCIHRYYDNVNPDPRLDNALWPYLQEMYWGFEAVNTWHPGLIRMYGQDILSEIPSNSVFFGGTDPGRFVITAFQEATRQPFYVVTQTALADNVYMEYLRNRINNAIWLPEQDDLQGAIGQYVQDVESGRAPTNIDINIENDHVTTKNAAGVMVINGIIAKLIFDKNKTNHAFYVEESYVISWMYPYLQPAGLIMKLNPEPTDLTSEMVAADRRFWDAYTERLMTHPDFVRDVRAQKAYSKMRLAIASLLAYRGRTNEAEYAFNQARKLHPASLEGAVRFADFYEKGRRWDEAIAVLEAYLKFDQKNAFVNAGIADFQKRLASDRKGSKQPSYRTR